MSKGIARNADSFANEKLVQEVLLPPLLEHAGFSGVRSRRPGGMKFVDATAADGAQVHFWLKQGWSTTSDYSASQFDLFEGPEAAQWPDERFIERVDGLVESAKNKGATHALFVHMYEGVLVNYVALEIGDVAVAYRRQIETWPKKARNTKSPTLWFEDSRGGVDAECVSAVTDLELPLAAIVGLAPVTKGNVGVKKVAAEVEVRLQQRLFRFLVGERYSWRCAVSDTAVKQVLDAAHLPGRDWRKDNTAEDGVLLRADLHRLLDCGLAELRDGAFWLASEVRRDEYAAFHGRVIRAS